MPGQLSVKYNNIKVMFKPQVQGDCGVFSFYYAARLRREVDSKRPQVWPPRKSLYEKTTDLGSEYSLRFLAKTGLLSAQGEILTADEMVRFVIISGYEGKLCKESKQSKRASFISDSLEADCPVLIPYIMSQTGPTSRKVKGSGSHWSVIINELSNRYVCINPWYPTSAKLYDKKMLLDSNQNVDKVKYSRYWIKPLGGGLKVVGNKKPKNLKRRGAKKLYDIFPGKRKQTLRYSLVRVE